MRSKILSLVLAVIVTAAVAPAASAISGARHIRRPTGPIGDGSHQRFVPRQVLVQFERALPARTRAVIHRAAGARVLRPLLLPNTYLVEVPTATGIRAALDRYRSSDLVRHATRNPLRHKMATTNDPMLGQLWGLTRIDAQAAWDDTIGSPSTIVAVIDDGVNWAHPDLDGNIFNNAADPLSGGDDDGNGLPNDFRGWDFSSMTNSSFGDNNPMGVDTHGTHVGGTIGAEGNNAVGITGVAQDVSLLPIRIFDDAGLVPADATINAFVYAGLMGAKVANGSFGGPDASAIEVEAIELSKDTLFVFSAGNDGLNNDQGAGAYPCNYAAEVAVDNAMCVAATDDADMLADFSNYGPNTVHISAPGTDILSTSRHAFPVREGFEGALGGWSLTGAWNTTTELFFSGARSLTDSPAADYANNANSAAQLPTLNLSGKTDCLLEHSIAYQLENTFDHVRVETSPDGVTWTARRTYTGNGMGGAQDEIDLGPLEGDATAFVRYHFTSDVSNVADGFYVDDLAVRCNSASGTDGDYQVLQGTSMAAPHVAGAAALVYTLQPAANPFSVRRALIESGELVPVGEQALTISGRRLNADLALQQDAVPTPVPSLGGPTLSQAFQKKASIVLNTSAAGAGGYWIRLDRTRSNSGNETRSFVSSAGSKTVSLPAGSTYCIAANSVEPVTANESNFGSEKCTAVPVNDRSMAGASGWAKKAASGTFMGDFLQTSKKGKTLSLSGLIFDKLALVATKCPGCGTVGLFFGKQSSPFKKVSLASATTKKLQIIQVFSRNDGPFISKVTVKVLSSSKPVKIEGFGVFQR